MAAETDSLQFIDYREPKLDVGEYQFKIEQTIQGETFTTTETYAVFGERFSMSPSLVHACYPPDAALGPYISTIPHISLNKATFPWERSPFSDHVGEGWPWLILLVLDTKEIDAGEASRPKVITLEALLSGENGVKFPNMALETSQSSKEKTVVVDVKRRLLEKLLPLESEIQYLAHVRKRMTSGNELAIILGNRLATLGSSTTVHLISIEGRYQYGQGFDYQSAAPTDFIRLVSLKQWSFSCPQSSSQASTGDFEQLIENLSSTELTKPYQSLTNENLQGFLKRGFVALPHQLRQCDKTYSWYHGPLVTFQQNKQLKTDGSTALPDFSDALVEYDANLGMFDMSYAAAYQLGRLLALQDTLLAKTLFQWKSTYNQIKALQAQAKEEDTLIGNETSLNDPNDQIPFLQKRMNQLALLETIPFAYLVADDAMLPEESIRFFTIDPYWIECLQYGAFTIGGSLRTLSDNPKTEELKEFYNLVNPTPKIRTGFLLHSQLIVGWPDIQTDAFDVMLPKDQLTQPIQSDALELLRMDLVAPDVLFCLFEGDIKVVDLFLKPEGLRYGVDEKSPQVFDKELMFQNNQTFPIELRAETENRVIAIDKVVQGLTGIISNVTPANFGMEMIDGSNKGRFIRNTVTN